MSDWLFEHEGYLVGDGGDKFIVTMGQETLTMIPKNHGTVAVKMWIEGYEQGRVEGGQARAKLIRKALGL